MKFAEHLGAHITPEWRKQYVQYEVMKDMLYEAVEQAPSTEVTEPEVVNRYFAQFEEKFFQFCDQELLKINTFFSEKLAEASRKFANLTADLVAAQEAAHRTHESTPALRNRRLSLVPNFGRGSAVQEKKGTGGIRKVHEIKLAFSEFYLSLILLQNYQTLNFTGFRKILKKHDKLLETDHGSLWRQQNVETAPFYTSKNVDHLIKETESLVIDKLESGNRQKAMKRLRVPPLGQESNPWTLFRVGLFSGVFWTIVAVVIIAAVVRFSILSESEGHHDAAVHWEAALRMYRGTFLIYLMIFLLGINTYGWRASGVNHVLIFELDPRNHLSHQQFLELAGFFGVLWSLSLLSYIMSTYYSVPVFANPLCLILFTILYLINPLHILHYKARMWLIRILYRILTAPFHHVGFADFWLADQLNSLSVVLLDLEFTICYFASSMDWTTLTPKPLDQRPVECGTISYGVTAIVACLPAWFRFAQCLRRYRDTHLVFPHIVNAGKYSTTFFVVLFSSLNSHYTSQHEADEEGEDSASVHSSPFFYLWIVALIVSTCYTTTWDLKMDWGLLDKNCGENKLLREEIVYGSKGYYYFAIIEDVILRFAWVLTVSVGQASFVHSQVLKTLLSSFELFRRFVWNFFRLENEHLNNCGQFRAVRDISITPIDANDQALLEKMMDEEDGVTNRRQPGSKVEKKKFTGRASKIETQVLLEEDEEEELTAAKSKNV